MGIFRITMRNTISQIESGATAFESTRAEAPKRLGVKDFDAADIR